MIAGEGSRNGVPYHDAIVSSVSYSGVLTLGGETFGELLALKRERLRVSAAPPPQRGTVPKIEMQRDIGHMRPAVLHPAISSVPLGSSGPSPPSNCGLCWATNDTNLEARYIRGRGSAGAAGPSPSSEMAGVFAESDAATEAIAEAFTRPRPPCSDGVLVWRITCCSARTGRPHNSMRLFPPSKTARVYQNSDVSIEALTSTVSV